MKKYKSLNIKGAVLDNNQLQEYMKKIASTHEINSKSNKLTFPIPRLKENFRIITKTYNLLNEHAKIGIGLYPAGEWLLDNYYIIEQTVKTIIKELTTKRYLEIPGLTNGAYKGFARIFVLAAEIIAYTDSKVDDFNIKTILNSYQDKKTLTMNEIWSLPLFLQIAIIENIKNVCEKIYFSQIQKYKVESIVERLVEKKESKNQKFRMFSSKYQKKVSYREMNYSFVEYMSYKLKKFGKQGLIYLNILEEEVNKMGTTVSEVIEKEHFDIALRKSYNRKQHNKYKRNNKIKFYRHF